MKNFWKHHQPTAAQRTSIEALRKKYAALKDALCVELPNCRDRALALTHLEDSFLRAECCVILFEPDAE